MSNTTVDAETYKETEATDRDLIKNLWARSQFESLSCKYQTVVPSVMTYSCYYWGWPELSSFIYFVLFNIYIYIYIYLLLCFFFQFYLLWLGSTLGWAQKTLGLVVLSDRCMFGLDAWLSPKTSGLVALSNPCMIDWFYQREIYMIL